MKNSIIWDINPSSLIEICQCFEGTCCLYLPVFAHAHACGGGGGSIFFRNGNTPTRLHGITTQKTVIIHLP